MPLRSLLCLILPTSPATADLWSFCTPSGNIECAADLDVDDAEISGTQQVADYGVTGQFKGFNCLSRRADDGHGFFLSRALQQAF